jgi:class 3 adenylate cyclase
VPEPSSASSIDAIATAVGAEEIDFAGQSSPDGAVTLLFSDIEDAGGVQERLGEPRFSEVVDDQAMIVRRLVDVHGGSIVKAEGAGFMMSFPSAHAGLRCAIEIQRTFAGHSIPESSEGLRPRIGLHSGFVIADATDFFGRNVVLAARIAEHARGREILTSAMFREYTQTDPSFEFEPRGEAHFKGVLGEHKLFAVRWADGDDAGASA